MPKPWERCGPFSPARRVVTTRPRRIVGFIPSLKAGRLLAWESQLERDFILTTDMDPAVTGLWDQPERIEYRLGKTRHTYTPDFRVERDGVAEVVEVKPAHFAARPDTAAVLDTVARVVRARGESFTVVGEEEIRAPAKIANARALFIASRQFPTPGELLECAGAADGGKAATLGSLSACLGYQDHLQILHLVAHGIVVVDISEPLGPNALVRKVRLSPAMKKTGAP